MSDVDDDKKAWWNSIKDAGADELKQFKADIAAAPQIPLGVEIHNQADEWRITALETENAQLRTERDGARAAAMKEAAGWHSKQIEEISRLLRHGNANSDGEIQMVMERIFHGTSNEAILALAEAPAGYMCVKVEDGKAFDISDMEPLDPEVAKVWDANTEKLYEP